MSTAFGRYAELLGAQAPSEGSLRLDRGQASALRELVSFAFPDELRHYYETEESDRSGHVTQHELRAYAENYGDAEVQSSALPFPSVPFAKSTSSNARNATATIV